MLINQKTTTQKSDDEMFSEGVTYINSSQWLFAHLIFSRLIVAKTDPSLPTLYNAGLCNFFAEDYSKTISHLSEALKKTSSPSALSTQTEVLPQALLTIEYQTNSHYVAVTETSLSLNAGLVKMRIRRLLVDANLRVENWQEVIRLSSLPEMAKCKNVIEALAIANTKINT